MRVELLVFPFVALLLNACDVSDKFSDSRADERLSALIAKHRTDISLDELKAIIVITEDGCLSCNKALSGLVQDHLEDKTALYWVSAIGTGVDISPYKRHGNRVVWDIDEDLKFSGILTGSGAIILHNGQIDRVLHLDARTLPETFNVLSAMWTVPTADTTIAKPNGF